MPNIWATPTVTNFFPKRSKKAIRLLFYLLIIIDGLYLSRNLDHQPTLAKRGLAQTTGPLITTIATNAANRTDSQIPKYEKFEITFQIENTVAGNYQLPYDPNPPPGIDLTYPKHQGISVDALFLPPDQIDWNKAYHQPAFYFEHFDDQVKKDRDETDREWYYPTGEFSWKVRFAPNEPGTWQYKLKVVDASGSSESTPQTFNVADSARKGFLKVSSTDAQYFEFDDGSPFHAVGFAYGPNGPPLVDPVLKSEPDFQIFQQNGINLLRVWISGIYGAAWMQAL